MTTQKGGKDSQQVAGTIAEEALRRASQESTLAECTRLETLCDGVFAIIITLLVLEIHRPSAAALINARSARIEAAPAVTAALR
jgi:Endosomal/lysosomal potassium channel TMEM175